MSVYKTKLIKTYNYFAGFFPSRLPVGMTEFDAWAEKIASTYQLPTKDLESVKFTLASIVIHLGPSDDKKPNWFFVKQLRAASAKQIAGAAFYEIKQKQKLLQEAAIKVAQLNAEATAPAQVASDVKV